MESPMQIVSKVLPGIIAHIPQTLLYWFLPSVLALFFGALLCWARVSNRHRPLYWICTVVISFFRGTPGIVQIYIVFFGLPKLIWAIGYDVSDWTAGVYFVIATTLNLSCFMAETLRGGYLALDRGQVEAGLSIGFSRVQNFVHVIAPQTLKVALLNIKNLEIDVLKDTSVAYTIGAVEIMGYANRMISLRSGLGQLWILGTAAVIYFIMCTLLEVAFNLATRRISRFEGVSR